MNAILPLFNKTEEIIRRNFNKVKSKEINRDFCGDAIDNAADDYCNNFDLVLSFLTVMILF